MPFGEELYADGTIRKTTANYSTSGQDAVRQRFTGYQKDTETGLDFAEARMYNNQHGRFTAIDPLLASGKSANPQTFNRFVYALNRPLLLTDQTGLQSGKKAKPETYRGAIYTGADDTGTYFSTRKSRDYPNEFEGDTTASRGGRQFHVHKGGYEEIVPGPTVLDVAKTAIVNTVVTTADPIGTVARAAGVDLSDPNVQMSAIMATGGLAAPEIADAEIVSSAAGLLNVEEEAQGFNLALGLEMGSQLEDFAAATGSETYFSRYGRGFSEEKFMEIANEANEINFNTRGFSFSNFAEWQETPMASQTGVTNFELDTLLSNPDLLEKTNFYVYPDL